MPESSHEYWNHNTAYHPWLIDIARRQGGYVLDVGGGDGLLAQRLSPVCRSVTAIEPDPTAARRAVERVAANSNVTIAQTDFHRFEPEGRRFDLITFVASLHHMDLRTALAKARQMLTPNGEIAVVGLSANTSVIDWAWAVTCLLPAAIGSRLHRETADIGVVMTDPKESLGEIRRAADEVIPGASVRRTLYYRYLLRWANGRSTIHT